VIDQKADAALAGLVLAAEDTYDQASSEASGAAILTPAVDARLTARYRLRGYVVGTDALFRRGAALEAAGERVFYGAFLESTTAQGEFLCVIRGTAGLIEWLEDGEFIPRPHPRAGRCEWGFWSIYQSFGYRPCGGTIDAPLVASITSAVGSGRLTVAGHSLGAALATYLAVDLADPQRLGKRVSLRAFASPRPGDGLFAQYAGALLSDFRTYARELDIVPRVPVGFSYASLPTTEIPWDANGVRVRLSAGAAGQHHLTSYMSQMDVASISGLPAIDDKYLAALILPSKAAA